MGASDDDPEVATRTMVAVSTMTPSAPQNQSLR